MMLTKWLYFGAHGHTGHYLHSKGMRSFYPPSGSNLKRLSNFDGQLAPQDSTVPYRAVISRLPGFGASALSFWDYTVDRRGGSNSIIFAPDPNILADDMLAGFEREFPEVYSRLPSLEIIR